MKLVIVESPTKCHTIQNYLGDEYKVVASCGHIRDLSTKGKGGLGVDIENDFKPTYVDSADKKKIIADLKKEAKKADEVLLATDPDREGEAISWHLSEVLKLDYTTTKRLEFHEITKPAVIKALNNPRILDMDLVNSQETRRIIDRIMGFKLSTLLKRKIGSLSAGRVQSVTLKLIVEREKKVLAFVPEEYWTIEGTLNNDIKVKLDLINNEDVLLKSEFDATSLLVRLPDSLKVKSIQTKERKVNPKPPFTTSSLQIEAFNKHKYSTKRTSSIAQKLYEGIDIGSETVGLITYMRTDSIRLSPEFIKDANDYIEKNYSSKYLGGISSKKNNALAQDAHEAIRPTRLDLTPKSIKSHLTTEQYNLYKLIYNRALASLMAPRIDELTSIKFEKDEFLFSSGGVRTIFDGFSKIYDLDNEDETKLPSLEVGQEIGVKEFNKLQHFTQGPSRFTEAKIVKTMEELGIGRPSTYASTISTLFDRDYIKQEKGVITPTEQGIETSDKLGEFFPPFMDTTYTATMEKDLDKIAEGTSNKLSLLNEFYNKFEPLYENAITAMKKTEPKQTGEICPKCGKPLVIRKGKYGEFVGCSNYPECDYIQPKEKKELEVLEGKVCPTCGKPLVKRHSKKGDFYACSGFPKCRYILGNEDNKVEEKKEEPTISDKLCPKCNSPLLIRKGKNGKSDFYACSSFPKCKYIESITKN